MDSLVMTSRIDTAGLAKTFPVYAPVPSEGVMAGLVIFLVFILVLILFFVICHWKIFTKAGVAGWKSIIPLYNIIVQLKIVKQPAYWIFFFFIPVVNIYFAVRHIHGLSRAFGKDTGFTIGLILLPFIFYPLLAFGDATYQYDRDNDLIHELQEMR